TVSDNLVLLLELVGEDGQRDDVAVLNQLLSVLGGLGIVKERIRVSTIRAVFQEGMPKNVLRRVMLVRPDKGNLSLVLMREGSGTNGTPIRTLKPALRCVAAKIGFHFEELLFSYCSAQVIGCPRRED